jgi:DNA-binding response OmpR family regulator
MKDRPRRVLLAEDDPSMRRLLAGTLRRDGFQVIEVENGAELLALVGSLLLDPAAAGSVDLVISDIRMPGASGLEVLARLRAGDRVTPVFLITAFGDPATHAEAQRLGARTFDKPFDLRELRAAVRDLGGAARSP